MTLTVERADGLVTVQDHGRVGYAHLGVPRAGALDQPAAALANRLVGNGPTRALLEVTAAGLTLRSDRALTFAVTGARCEVTAGGRHRPFGEPVTVPAGTRIVLGPALTGVRSYLAVSGGLAVARLLGSRSTDTLSGLGPPVVTPGTVLPVGSARRPRPVDVVPPSDADARVRLWPGPRPEAFGPGTWSRLVEGSYAVSQASDRVGIRLVGPPLARAGSAELPSEGMVTGAIQVPPDGQPVILMHDHPVTGGYPVVAVVDERDLPVCAQLRPGDPVPFISQGVTGR